MKAYFIDPVQKAVSEIDYNGDWRTIKNHLHCDLFDIVRLDPATGDGIYVDDEGLVNGAQHRYGMFMLTQTDAPEGNEPRRLPFAGYGLALGSNEGGEATAVGMTLAELQAMVSFPTMDEVLQLAAENKLG